MKLVLLAGTFLLTSLIGFGQCPDETIFLFDQQDVDLFTTNYPNCTELEKGLLIGNNGGSDITNLDGISVITATGVDGGFETGMLGIRDCFNLSDLSSLNNLESINGDFTMQNTAITNLIGLSNLTTISGSFNFNNNHEFINFDGLDSLTELKGVSVVLQDAFQNFNGLENITSFSGGFQVAYCESFQSFSGLNNLTSVGSTFGIIDCDSLEELTHLENLESILGMAIQYNDALTSIMGLSNISPSSVLASLSIRNNPNLPYCSIDALCENFDNPSISIVILDNAPGCNTPQEVEDLCGAVFIPDTNFLNALLNYSPTIDTNNDDLIQFDEAEAFTGTLDVADQVIFDFTGLEAFVNITGFNGSENFMGGLSLKNNTLLTSVDFSDCPDLEGVNLKNGNNTAITTFNGVNCPSLQFVCVDDVPFAEANFINIDSQVQFVDDCEFLAIPTFNLEDAITVFPNPVSDNLNISIAGNFSYKKTEVYSVSGQKLKETSATQISMIDLTAGIYFVKVISEEGSITKKIVKQ